MTLLLNRHFNKDLEWNCDMLFAPPLKPYQIIFVGDSGIILAVCPSHCRGLRLFSVSCIFFLRCTPRQAFLFFRSDSHFQSNRQDAVFKASVKTDIEAIIVFLFPLTRLLFLPRSGNFDDPLNPRHRIQRPEPYFWNPCSSRPLIDIIDV